ncbi:GNAT family N-acetyltransferase [Pseudalkalibacillus berkeleyi]|uniref:GNAT family N-acetyltransferase n=1 Tax=Pseudalkalibacillus berkeleyi TaxID=1069813 RepID=A0ABS9H1V7_9BACL|nr:GNAT family N-acetyltransferase [Pseudalkalibacillus berkeleyi]MCF6137768.1 GNAT family N-acetyltransferase [Pseudalkalibacillus berkeleyi]
MNLVRWDERIVPVEEICQLWNRTLGDEFPLTERLFTQNSVECPHIFPEGSWYVTEGNQVIGFVVTKVTRERVDLLPEGVGWIQALLVAPEHRNKGIGKALLEKAELALQSTPITKISIGRDVHHYFPGIPNTLTTTMKWFERNGYEEAGTDYDFIQTYENQPKQPEHIDKISFTVLKKEEENEFLAFLSRCFPGRWHYEAWDYFRSGGEGKHFIIARENQDIIGFVRINDSDAPVIGPNVYWAEAFTEKTGGIGPLGIDRAHRKKGYGRAIVEHAIYTAYERNCMNIIIDWTELTTFYESFGFKKWKTYVGYEKQL